MNGARNAYRANSIAEGSIKSATEGYSAYRQELSVLGLEFTHDPENDGSGAPFRSPFALAPFYSPASSESISHNQTNTMHPIDIHMASASTAPSTALDPTWYLLKTAVEDYSQQDFSLVQYLPEPSSSSAGLPLYYNSSHSLPATWLFNLPSPESSQCAYSAHDSYADPQHHAQTPDLNSYNDYHAHAVETVFCAEVELQQLEGATTLLNPESLEDQIPCAELWSPVSTTISKHSWKEPIKTVKTKKVKKEPKISKPRERKPKAPRLYVCTFESCAGRGPFKRLFNLGQHLKTHDTDRPHVCPELDCSYSSKRRGDLTRHQRIHSGATPYVCKFGCGKRFSRGEGLKRHHTHDHSDDA